MINVFEGEVLNLNSIFYESDGISKETTFDFIEIKNKTSKFIFKTPFYKIPCTENFLENESYLMIIKYYRIEECERKGILDFQELLEYKSENINCLITKTFKVEKPCYFQEFNKGTAKYLIVKSKVNRDYEIFILKGELLKEGPFFRVLGEGPYIFKSKDILYEFKYK